MSTLTPTLAGLSRLALLFWKRRKKERKKEPEGGEKIGLKKKEKKNFEIKI